MADAVPAGATAPALFGLLLLAFAPNRAFARRMVIATAIGAGLVLGPMSAVIERSGRWISTVSTSCSSPRCWSATTRSTGFSA